MTDAESIAKLEREIARLKTTPDDPLSVVAEVLENARYSDAGWYLRNVSIHIGRWILVSDD